MNATAFPALFLRRDPGGTAMARRKKTARRAETFWRNHSKTIVSLTLGSAIGIFARFYWHEGGPDFDLATLVAGILIAFGLQGVIDHYFCEINKPEAPPP